MRTLPDHPLLDRAVRGRAWIPLLGVMLAGIVAMQVEVLKLGASIGRSIQQGTALQSRNELLRANVAWLGDDQRIMGLAAKLGMVMPAPAAVGFLSAQPGGEAQRAVANIHAPDPATFASLTSGNGAVLSAATTGVAGATAGASGASPGTGTTSAAGTGAAATTSVPAPAGPTAPTTAPSSNPTPTQSPVGQTGSSGGAAAPTGG